MSQTITHNDWGKRTVDSDLEVKLRANNVNLAILKGSPYTAHLKTPGFPSALCGKTPGKKAPGSTNRNRTGWRLYLDYTTTHTGCEVCLQRGRLLPMP